MDPNDDLKQLLDIPDPFADAAAADLPTPDVSKLPASPSRAHSRRIRVIAAVGAIAYEAAWLAVGGLRADLPAVPAWALALGLVAPLAASALALAAVTSRGARGLGESTERLALLVGAPIVLFAVATLVASHAATPVAPSFWNGTLKCVAMTTMLTAGPLVFGAIALRRAFASAAPWRMAALGVACGALAAAAMRVMCPTEGGAHVLLGHGVAMLIGAAAGVALARWTRA